MKLISVDIWLRNFATVKVEYDPEELIGKDHKETKINFHVYNKRTCSGPIERCA
jgi:hypothetical protein